MHAMNLPHANVRYRAVSMEFAADLDAHSVEMHVRTDTGKTIAVVCPRNSIFAVQKHIEQMAQACPEIATWSDGYRTKLESAGALSSFPQRRLEERNS